MPSSNWPLWKKEKEWELNTYFQYIAFYSNIVMLETEV